MRNNKPSLFAGMCSLSLFAEKEEELTCRNLYIANDSPHDRYIDYFIESAMYGFLFTSCKTLENEQMSAANE